MIRYSRTMLILCIAAYMPAIASAQASFSGASAHGELDCDGGTATVEGAMLGDIIGSNR